MEYSKRNTKSPQKTFRSMPRVHTFCYALTGSKVTVEQAQITKRVYPHLLRHSVATTLLERGRPIEQMQKFLGHAKLEATQLYAESSAEMR